MKRENKIHRVILDLTDEIADLISAISHKLDKSEYKHVKPVKDSYITEALENVEADLQKLFDKIKMLNEKNLTFEKLKQNGNLHLDMDKIRIWREELQLDFDKIDLLLNNHSENGEPKHDKTLVDLRNAYWAFKNIFDVNILVQNVFNTVHRIVSGGFSGLYDDLELHKLQHPEEPFEKTNGYLAYIGSYLTSLDERLARLESQDLSLTNVDKIRNEIVLDLADISTYLNLIRRRKLRLTDALYKDERYKIIMDRLDCLYEEFKNKMNTLINLLKTTVLYEDTEIQQGIDILAWKLDICGDADCDAMNDKFGKIHHNFMCIRFIINSIVRGYIKEDNCQDNFFDEILYYLTMIDENINYIKEKMRDNNINVDVINNTMDAVGSSVVGLNTSIKKLNAGKVPNWFLKNNTSMPSMTQKSKTQAMYSLCIISAKTFLSLIDKIREMQENFGGAKIRENFDIEKLNLMSGIEQELFSRENE